MPEVVVVDAVRSPIGRRGGFYSSVHSLDVLGPVMRALFDRTTVDPSEVGYLNYHGTATDLNDRVETLILTK